MMLQPFSPLSTDDDYLYKKGVDLFTEQLLDISVM